MSLFNIRTSLREGTILNLIWNINKINYPLYFLVKINLKGQFYFWKMATTIFPVSRTLLEPCHSRSKVVVYVFCRGKQGFVTLSINRVLRKWRPRLSRFLLALSGIPPSWSHSGGWQVLCRYVFLPASPAEVPDDTQH